MNSVLKLKIDIVHGPNLNLLGKREPEVYGYNTFDKYLEELEGLHQNVRFSYYQSNVEGELINFLHRSEADGIILNAGGYSHTSVALADAVGAITPPVINIHISNIYQREKERHQELLAKYCIGGLFGLGLESYHFATKHFLSLLT